jgi:hypothetical protein
MHAPGHSLLGKQQVNTIRADLAETDPVTGRNCWDRADLLETGQLRARVREGGPMVVP